MWRSRSAATYSIPMARGAGPSVSELSLVEPARALSDADASPAAAVCQHLGMNLRSLARIVGVVVTATWALVSAPVATFAAAADPCSDVAVVWARGTHQEPGLGNIGQAFVDSLSSQTA